MVAKARKLLELNDLLAELFPNFCTPDAFVVPFVTYLSPASLRAEAIVPSFGEVA